MNLASSKYGASVLTLHNRLGGPLSEEDIFIKDKDILLCVMLITVPSTFISERVASALSYVTCIWKKSGSNPGWGPAIITPSWTSSTSQG
jgi:hypothetical protein